MFIFGIIININYSKCKEKHKKIYTVFTSEPFFIKRTVDTVILQASEMLQSCSTDITQLPISTFLYKSIKTFPMYHKCCGKHNGQRG